MPQLTVQELRALNRAGNPTFAGIYVLRKLAQRTAKNDNPFLVLELGDRTGSFGANIFGDSPFFAALKAAGEGVVVRLVGEVSETRRTRSNPSRLLTSRSRLSSSTCSGTRSVRLA